MEFTAKKIAEFLKGTVDGDANAIVSNVSKIEEGIEGTLSFLANSVFIIYFTPLHQGNACFASLLQA